jgi:hypothetical protein
VKKYIKQLKRQIVAVLVAVMAMSAFAIDGATATANSHPFAVELQNIINNLPTGHTFESATLINLDERGEQQGVAVLTRHLSEYYGIVYRIIVIYMVGNDIKIIEVSTFDIYADVRPFLSNNNMLVEDVGHGSFNIYILYRFHGGEWQWSRLMWGPGGNGFAEWVSMDVSLWESYENISEARFEQLRSEFGIHGIPWHDRRLPDQTAQILAMQAAAPKC